MLKSGGAEWSPETELRPAEITVKDGVVSERKWLPSLAGAEARQILIPGYSNAHNHTESGLVSASQSAPTYARFGVNFLVDDYHEMGNAGGLRYIKWGITNADSTPLCFAHGASSSIPADPNETVGTTPFGPAEIEALHEMGCSHLAEVMAYYPYIHRADFVCDIVKKARELSWQCDGHAVGLCDLEDARKYFRNLDISTNHEATGFDEARQQLELGVKIWIRRGSAANDFDALVPLIEAYPALTGGCTDDLHADMLLEGRGVPSMFRDAVIDRGISLVKSIQAFCYNPRIHYQRGGCLQIGDAADLVLLETDSLQTPRFFNVRRTYVNGTLLAEDGEAKFAEFIPDVEYTADTWQRTAHVLPEQLKQVIEGETAQVIVAEQGKLSKRSEWHPVKQIGGILAADFERDLALVGGLNRYRPDWTPSIMLLRGFGIKTDFAMVSSVNHDRHSPIYLGTKPDLIAEALNMVIDARGGLSLVSASHRLLLPLPIGGLMSNLPIREVAARYGAMERIVSEELTDGSMHTPYMMLSFMGLTVIPDLGVGDDGLYRMGPHGPERIESIFA
jgi:adenine deaminase